MRAVVAILCAAAFLAACAGHRRGPLQKPSEPDSVRVVVDLGTLAPDSGSRTPEVVRIRRRISAPGRSAVGWMEVGDSIPLRVIDTRCTPRMCVPLRDAVSDSGWEVADSSILRLRPVPGDPRAAVYAVPLRTGRTRVRVGGVHGPGDTLSGAGRLPRELALQVVVTEPVARVELRPRLREVDAGSPVMLHALAVDVNGRVLRGAPVEVQMHGGGRATHLWTRPGVLRFRFESPGRHQLIASFNGRADTLVVDVVPRPGQEP